MANVNAPRGLIPYRHYDGSVWNGSANIYYASASNANNFFIGDPVGLIPSQNDGNGIPAVTVYTASTQLPALIGSVVGIVSGGQPIITVTRDLVIYRTASVAQYILVCDDPTVMFMIQDNGVSGLSPLTWAGKTAALISSASGSTITGYSGWNLSGASVGITGSADLKIMRPLDQADNAVGVTVSTTLYGKWLVKINNHMYANATLGSSL